MSITSPHGTNPGHWGWCARCDTHHYEPCHSEDYKARAKVLEKTLRGLIEYLTDGPSCYPCGGAACSERCPVKDALVVLESKERGKNGD